MNVAVDVAKLPEPSVTVNVTVSAPVAPHKSLKPEELCVQVKFEPAVGESPQASVAVAPPWLLNHAAKAAPLPAPSHSTVEFAAANVITGSTLSTTVIVAVAELKLPAAS